MTLLSFTHLLLLLLFVKKHDFSVNFIELELDLILLASSAKSMRIAQLVCFYV